MQGSNPQPLHDLLSFGADPDPALTVGAKTWTYAELRAQTTSMAAALSGRALPGSRVASWLPKTLSACLLPLAAPAAGLVHVPINSLLRRGQVAHILADAGASLLVTTPDRARMFEGSDVPPACTTIYEDQLREPAGSAIHEREPTDLAALLYTSGSTGRPKGVMLSHANLWLGALSVRTFLAFDRTTCTLCALPLAFDYGQNQLLATWSAGGHAVVLDYLLPAQVVSAIERYGINTLAGVPSLWADLAEARWSERARHALRCITNSGGHLPASLVHSLQELFPQARLHLMYGLTEAFRASALDPALVDEHPGSVGRAIPFAELFVLDGAGQEVPAGEPGELVQAGPLVANGYWNDPERTRERFRPAPAGSTYGGLAVWSGDTVTRDADGLLRVIGRRDEMIKISGYRVSPSEIEEEAVASGVVREAVAIGLPDARRGAAIRLFVRGNREQAAILEQHLGRQLPAFMRPSVTTWCDSLPRTPNGKIDRAALRQECGS